MKRIPELRRLSEDHHHGLVLARKARLTHDEDVAKKVWLEVVSKFQSELEPHFTIEEKYLAPPLKVLGEKVLLKRFHRDHQKLRLMVHDQAEHTLSTLNEFGGILKAHIRFEERELFEIAQTRLSPESLQAIAKACELLANPNTENIKNSLK